MSSSTKMPADGKSNIVSLQKGYPKRPEHISPEDFAKSAESLVQFEMNYQRKQFESFTAMVTNLTSLKGAGVQLRFKEGAGTSSVDKSANVNVVDLRAKAPTKLQQGG